MEALVGMDYNKVFIGLYVLSTVRKIVNGKEGNRWETVKSAGKELVILMVMLKVMSVIETYLSDNYITPILNMIFGDLEEEKRKLEQQEAQLREMMRRRQAQAGN